MADFPKAIRRSQDCFAFILGDCWRESAYGLKHPALALFVPMDHQILRQLVLPSSTTGCGKPHVRWCGKDNDRNPVTSTMSRYYLMREPVRKYRLSSLTTSPHSSWMLCRRIRRLSASAVNRSKVSCRSSTHCAFNESSLSESSTTAFRRDASSTGK